MPSPGASRSPREQLRLWILLTVVVAMVFAVVPSVVLAASTSTALAPTGVGAVSRGAIEAPALAPSFLNSPLAPSPPAAAATSPPEWETGSFLATIPVQVEPFAMAFDSGNGNLYVANALSDNVSVISGATSSLVATIPVGSIPQGVAVDSANGEIYVADTDSNNVTVIDGATDQVVPTGPAGIGVGGDPIGIAFDPDKGDLYVANEGSANVSVIQGATNTVVATVATPTGSAPFGLAYDSANGDVYVSDSDTAEVTVVDAATNAVVGSPIGVQTTPTGVAYDPANGHLYVANFESSTVSVINGATNTVVTTVTAGADCEFLAYDPGNGDMYVTNTVGYSVSVISGETDTVVATLGPTGGLTIARGIAFDDANGDLYAAGQAADDVVVISTLLMVGGASPYLRGLGQAGSSGGSVALPDGAGPFGAVYDSADADIYVADAGNAGLGSLPSANVSVVSGATNSVVGTVAVGGGPVAVAYDSGNGNIYVAEAGAGQHNVSVIDTATDTVIATIDVGFAPSAIAYDSETGNLYVSCTGSDATYVINGPTNTVVAELTGESIPGGIAFDPANGDVYVAMTGSGSVTVLDGATNTVLTSVGAGTGPYAIAYDGATGDLFVGNVASDNVTVISGSLNTEIANIPVGSGPEGVTYDSANFNVYVSNVASDNVSVLDGGTLQVVASLPVGTSPTGMAYDSGNGELYITNSGSNNLSVFETLTGRNVPTDPFLDVGQTLLLGAPLIGEGTGALTLSFASSTPTGLACSADPIGSASLTGACVGESPGTYPVSFSLTDSEGFGVETTILVTVYADPTATTPTALPATVDLGQATVLSTTATGGRGGFTYAWSGLPAGCVSENAASISCTPTAAGSASVVVRVTDDNGFALTEGPTTLLVSTDPSVSTPTASPAALDVGQTTALTAVLSNPGSGTTSYQWNGLPSGCSSTDGLTLSCAPTVTGTFSIELTVQDSNGVGALSGTVALVVAPTLGPAQVAASAASVAVGGVVLFSVSVTGGSGGYSYAWSGLPAGCTTANSGTIACSPTSTTGSPFTVSVKVTDSNGGNVRGSSAPVTITAAPSSSSSTSSPTNFDWAAIGLAVVALALAAVALLLGGRRGRSPPPATLPPVPPAATTTGPPPPWSEQPPPPGQ